MFITINAFILKSDNKRYANMVTIQEQKLRETNMAEAGVSRFNQHFK